MASWSQNRLLSTWFLLNSTPSLCHLQISHPLLRVVFRQALPPFYVDLPDWKWPLGCESRPVDLYQLGTATPLRIAVPTRRCHYWDANSNVTVTYIKQNNKTFFTCLRFSMLMLLHTDCMLVGSFSKCALTGTSFWSRQVVEICLRPVVGDFVHHLILGVRVLLGFVVTGRKRTYRLIVGRRN